MQTMTRNTLAPTISRSHNKLTALHMNIHAMYTCVFIYLEVATTVRDSPSNSSGDDQGKKNRRIVRRLLIKTTSATTT